MGGILNSIGTPLLNTLTCSDGDLYNGRGVSAEALKIQYQQTSYVVTGQWVGNVYKYWLAKSEPVNEEQTVLNYIFSSPASPEITSCYIGLLVEAPQYYMGISQTSAPIIHGKKSLANLEIGSTEYRDMEFLNVHEIPARSHNDILSETDPNREHYWSGYQRVLLSQLTQNQADGKYVPTSTIMTGAQTVENITVIDSTHAYNLPQLVNKNTSGIFLGENGTAFNWPAIRHFGLFRTKEDISNTIIYTEATTNNRYWIESTPDLYLWGELTEGNNWYHEYTGGSASWEAKKASLYENTGTSAAPNYVLTSDTEYSSSKTYYEKLGIIVKPNEGAAFGIGAFQMIFENSTFEV